MQFDASEWLASEAAPSLIVSIDGNIIAVNQAAGRLAGQTPDYMANQPLVGYLLEPADKVLSYLRICGRTRECLPGAFSFKDGGNPQETRFEGKLLRPRSGDNPGLVILVCRDRDDAAEQFLLLNEKIEALSREINIRRRAEAERDELLSSERAARLEAERTSRVKDEFLATLSHELRTPLNAILGWTQILKMTGASDQDIANGLEVIERNTRIQTKLIEDLLDMSRIIAGKLRLDVQRVELSIVLGSAIDAVQPAMEAKGLRFQKVMDSMSGIVMGDPARLQQIFWNLLSNAVKFTPKGGRIQVVLERVNSHVEISFIDTGTGIKPESLPHVFDRFHQGDSSTTRHFGGLGLGLSIVKHLAELHGGSVRAKSSGEGKGATFVVSLPVTVLHEEQPSAPQIKSSPASKRQGDCPSVLDGLKVLAVDDDPDSLAMVARVLRMCKCDVVTSSSAAEGLEQIQRFRPDVLISDIGMPGQDGYAFLRKIRELPLEKGGRTPAIALTAFARSEDRLKAISAGFQMHIAKPTESAELLAVVASVAGLTLRGPSQD